MRTSFYTAAFRLAYYHLLKQKRGPPKGYVGQFLTALHTLIASPQLCGKSGDTAGKDGGSAGQSAFTYDSESIFV